MKHLAENTIQAFLDGELSNDLMAQATAHLAGCERCADALVAAEAEIAEINLAFAAENSAPCPTQRIWARIENEIDVCAWQPKMGKVQEKSVWARFADFLTPAQVAFASGLAAVVLISLVSLSVFEKQLNQPQDEIALERPIIENRNPSQILIPESSLPVAVRPVANDSTARATNGNAARFVKASFQPARNNVRAVKSKADFSIANSNSNQPLAEEKDYLNSIAALSKAVSADDEMMLRPSFRVEYERNLAMVDQAIRAMQKQARSNPRDENARRILFASYQNKIELLNLVSEKSQLVASMQ